MAGGVLRRFVRRALRDRFSPSEIAAAVPWGRILRDGPAARGLYDALLDDLLEGRATPGWTPSLAALHEQWRPRGVQVLPEHFYTTVFDPDRLPREVWDGRFEAGVAYDAEAQPALWRDAHHFADELAEFPDEADGSPDDAERFFWKNSEFSHQDAVLYYSLIRRLRPARIVEVGAGFSTLLASAAAAKNGSTAIACVEPYPRPFLARGLPGVTLHASPVQQAPPELFSTLSDGDVLFIDCSHVSKTGSDVNHLFLRIVPSLAPGVWVHVHDVFLPFEYPIDWPRQRLYFNEQYVLAALLAHSATLEVKIGNYFLIRVAGPALREFSVPGREVGLGGASFWIRTRERPKME